MALVGVFLNALGGDCMPGPVPNRHVRRRNKGRPDWVQLPPGGFDGPVPEWPLPFAPDENQAALWAELWRLPQAFMWSGSGFDRVLARYVVAVSRAEDPDTTNGKLLEEARHLEDRLGLSPAAMKRLFWEVVDDEASDSGHLAEVTRIDRFAGL